ncbi:MAG TPA: protein kinase [Bryobacteraceae bacterium]
MAFQLGETYSGYKFLDVVKRSRNGVEYRVENTIAQRLEILRALPPNAANDQEQTERFLRELRVRARLVHPNIVTLFNAVELDRQLVMTTELVDGPTLAERLAAGPIPIDEARDLMRQALTAVGFAHVQRVVHRDINPENMVLTQDGVLKLANFAAAKSAASPKLTQVGAAVGNLKYISPEQVKGVAEADARSDLYSLGMVFYEMLSGRAPFASASQFELMLAHVNQTPAPPSSVNPAVPAELDAVVMKAIAKAPDQRYQTAEEFRTALDEPAAHVGAEPEPEACSAPIEEIPPRVIVLAPRHSPAPVTLVAEAAPVRTELAAASAVAVAEAPEPESQPAPAHPAPVFLPDPPARRHFSLVLCSAAMFVGLLMVVFWFAGR